MDALVGRIAAHAATVSRADGVAVFAASADGSLTCVAATGLLERADGVEACVATAARACLASGSTVRVDPTDRVLDEVVACLASGAASALHVALRGAQGRPVGVLSLVARRRHAFPVDGDAPIEALGLALASCLERGSAEEPPRAAQAAAES